MTRKYSLVIEGGSGGYSAYVPEYDPGDRELRGRVDRSCPGSDSHLLENIQGDRSPTSIVREIEVELPA